MLSPTLSPSSKITVGGSRYTLYNRNAPLYCSVIVKTVKIDPHHEFTLSIIIFVYFGFIKFGAKRMKFKVFLMLLNVKKQSNVRVKEPFKNYSCFLCIVPHFQKVKSKWKN